MQEYNTPSGGLNTALDKFVWHYVCKGYRWENAKNEHGFDDDIIFSKSGSVLRADAQYSKNRSGRTVLSGFNVRLIRGEWYREEVTA